MDDVFPLPDTLFDLSDCEGGDPLEHPLAGSLKMPGSLTLPDGRFIYPPKDDADPAQLFDWSMLVALRLTLHAHTKPRRSREFYQDWGGRLLQARLGYTYQAAGDAYCAKWSVGSGTKGEKP